MNTDVQLKPGWLAKDVARAAKRARELRMGKWLPIADAPKDGSLVDLWVVNADFPVGRNGGAPGARLTYCWYDGSDWRHDYHRVIAAPAVVTHFMPIPEPP